MNKSDKNKWIEQAKANAHIHEDEIQKLSYIKEKTKKCKHLC